MGQVLRTARLTLEPWRDDLLDAFARLAADERVTRFIGDGKPWSRERAAARHESLLRHWETYGYGWRAMLDGEGFAGIAALNRLGTLVPGIEESAVEIGWWVDPRSWGRGYATEAALALRDDAFGGVGARRLVARCQAANPASERVMVKIGMRRWGDADGQGGLPVRVYTLDRASWRELTPRQV
jgi:RimJ/RimL family protein N-acetyltransferase